MQALILDDDPAIGRLVRKIAASVGWDAVVTSSAEEFKARYEDGVPDLILLDLQIGEADGIEQLRFLHSKSYRNPLVLMSGFDDRVLATTEQLARALGLKPAAALSKPVRAEHLKRVLDEIKLKAEPLSPERVLEAIKNNELFLEYQPIVTRDRHAVRWLEALVRWNHPIHGRLPPDRFIGLAEQSTPVMDAVTDWVVATAARESGRLRGLGLVAPMAVNISGKNLHDLNFPDRMQALIQHAGIPAGQFCLEITESAASEDPARTMDIVGRLRLKGIQIAIDDFGTGYSSLKQLRQLPFSALKIDRSFVADIAKSSDALVIVKSTIDLARNMELESVAEGVETEEAAALLKTLGVDALQGYLIARPMLAEQVADWLKPFPAEQGRAQDKASQPAPIGQLPKVPRHARISLR